jgi:glutamyl-tRNA reductase
VRHLRDRGSPQVRILNRTASNAEALAACFGGTVLAWEDVQSGLEWADLAVTSVASPAPVLAHELLATAMRARAERPLMIIDLGVPRNVAASAAQIHNVYLYDIDHLTEIVQQNKRAREKEIPRAECIIEEQIENFVRWHSWKAANHPVEAVPKGEASSLTSAIWNP